MFTYYSVVFFIPFNFIYGGFAPATCMEGFQVTFGFDALEVFCVKEG